MSVSKPVAVPNARHILSLVLFSIGVLLGMLVAGGAIWGDLEASLFGIAASGGELLPGLKCPVVITTAESGVVRLSLKNPLERATEFVVRAYISSGFVTLMREEQSSVLLEPGEIKTLEWRVTAEDAAYGGRLILVRVYQFPRYPIPARDASCGILVVRTNYFKGVQILTALLIGSLLGMGGGLGLWARQSPPQTRFREQAIRVMGILGGFVLVGILFGFLGWWFLGLITIVVTLALIGGIVGHFLRCDESR
ncbi:MAG: hypothetical protein ACK8QZ_08090, partial [Anaerolineales bacterium]